MQSQRNNQKNQVNKYIFKIKKHVFFHFSSFWPLLFHLCITFSFFFANCAIQIAPKSPSFSSTNHVVTPKCNKVIFKDFLKGFKTYYEIFDRFFNIKTTPSTFRGSNFLPSNPFLSIFNVTYAPRGGLHLLFEHHKQWVLLQKKQQANLILSVWTLTGLP